MSNSITLGFINNYCAIVNTFTNGSLVSNMPVEYDPNLIEFYGNGGYAFFNDLIMQFAVDSVNNSTLILPGVQVEVKRFTDCGEYYPDADWGYWGNSGGFASSIMSQDISLVYPEVVGIIGTEYSTTAR
ncbi:hypothetical protein BDR26DRAFT_914815 [Obelidium mucronatum]|nr:hypothetical protein BDR26DRAFT_914815 [Obelidium mucronatum]